MNISTRGAGIVAGLLLLVCAGLTVAAEEGADEPVVVKGAMIGRMGEPVAVDPDFEFSTAETKLWQTAHLENLHSPTRLFYEFSKSGSYEAGFSDSVFLDILRINMDGTRDAALQFFTGDRQQAVTADNLTSVSGNPVIGVYLQGDVIEMNRLTDGSWRYFQRRIKSAFAGAAEIVPITIEFAGKQVAAERIMIQPYKNDPHHRQLQAFANKRYEFVLSKDIPGMLYQIRTIVPAADDASNVLIEEILTLKQVEQSG